MVKNPYRKKVMKGGVEVYEIDEAAKKRMEELEKLKEQQEKLEKEFRRIMEQEPFFRVLKKAGLNDYEAYTAFKNSDKKQREKVTNWMTYKLIHEGKIPPKKQILRKLLEGKEEYM